jgi:F-type H+-transporting ATPase subunit epsilon
MPTALEIVTPERLVLSRPVDMVVIPAAEGELGVLAGHAPMIVLLRGGTIRLYEGSNVTDTIFVASGFAEITAERCTVLANEIFPLAQVSRRAAEMAVTEAQQAYEAADKTDFLAVETAMSRIQSSAAMLEVAQAP